ncbi:MAG TPA: PRTRC system protein E [Terriglobales bacterium]|jgi:PRTRC genetic system protein E
MFRELVTLLERRTLMLTLSRVDDSAIRVCVVPKRLKEDTGENAMCTPLVVTGTPDELDTEFAAQLTRYTGSLMKLGSNLSAIEAAHNAAVKAVEDEKKKDLDRKCGKSSGSRSTTGAAEPSPGPAVKDGKPVFGMKNASGSSAPMTLFDAPPQERAPHEAAAASTATPEVDQQAGENSSLTAASSSAGVEGAGQGSNDSLQLSYPD